MERPGWAAVVAACAAACAIAHTALVPGPPAGQAPIAVPLVTTAVSAPEPVAPRVAFTDDKETSRTQDADVSDAVAADGSARRTIAANQSDPDGAIPVDERGPAYSPDGVSLVWSREVSGRGRELVRGRADGSDAAPLDYERDPSDVDVDPVWSPDGNRIAFTRYEWNTTLETTVDPATWVIDLAAERKEGAPAPARRLSEMPPAGVRFGEEDPSWSPDGSFLVVSRRYAPDLKIELGVPESASAGQEIGMAATVTNIGRVGTEPTDIVLELPGGLAAAALPEGCLHLSGTISCPIGPLPAGASSVQKWPVRGNIPGKYDVEARVPMPGDANPANNGSTAAVAILPGDLQVTLPPESKVFRGESITLSSTVTNLGPGRTGAAEVTFSPSPGLSITDPNERCVLKGRDLVCPVPPLAPNGKPPEWSFTVRADEWGNQSITGSVVGLTTESRLDNNTAVSTVDVPEVIIEGPGPSPGQDPSPDDGGITLNMAVALAARVGPPLGASGLTVPAVWRPPLQPFTSTAEIWVVDAGSGAASPLAAPDPCTGVCTVSGLHPAWSSDGSRIVVSDLGKLHVVTLRDGDATGGPDVPHAASSVTAITGFDPTGEPTPGPAEPSSAEDPAWAPDGAEIFFSGQPAGQPDQWDIYAVAPDGSKLRPVVQGPGRETEPALQPWADLAVELAAEPPGIQPDQTSTLRAKVVNNGPSRAASVNILVEAPAGLTVLSSSTPGCDVSGGSVTCRVPEPLEKGASAAVDVLVRGEADGEHLSTATVTAETPDPRTADTQPESNNQASAGIKVGGLADVAVELTLDRIEGWTGGKPATGKATVINNGPGTAKDVRLKASVSGAVKLQPVQGCPDSVCQMGELPAGTSRIVELTLDMPARDPATGQVAKPVALSGELIVEVSAVTADPAASNNVDRAAFTVRQPTVRLFPAVAKPGDVVTVVVEGLPPDEPVRLTWSKGIAADRQEIKVTKTELRHGLVLLRRDQLGTREIVVTSPKNLFGDLRAPMLVVARPVAPMPDFIGRG